MGVPVEGQFILKTLIAKLAKSLLNPKYNPGYQTRGYRRLDMLIIAHDSVDFGPSATVDERKRIKNFWISDDVLGKGLPNYNDCEGMFIFDSLPSIYPASGLPMINGSLDVAGNICGMSDFDGEKDATTRHLATNFL